MSARTDLLSTLPTTVADVIKLALPGLHECKGITGRFNLERLLKESVNAPAVLVSIVGLKWDDTKAGMVDHYMLDMAAFIVTKDVMGLPRDAAASVICQQLCKVIPNNSFGDVDCGPAIRVSAQPIVGSDLRKAKAGLWAVSWQQPCVMDCPDAAAPIPIELYVGMPPDTGADNVGSYVEIGGDA